MHLQCYFRRRKNALHSEPASGSTIPAIYQALAALRDISEDELRQQVTQNFMRLFGSVIDPMFE
jgi:Tat protein secretion system quality control protein TatD with DNase activity